MRKQFDNGPGQRRKKLCLSVYGLGLNVVAILDGLQPTKTAFILNNQQQQRHREDTKREKTKKKKKKEHKNTVRCNDAIA